ncbi:hypothetical protein N7G274_002507 [Stereocaulon virgatum]|uniref:Uncharacterized protein n=1 Tax=Stereocaulon virgatum TaxID=373712 RepID=A0ABR4AJ88_9LECA
MPFGLSGLLTSGIDDKSGLFLFWKKSSIIIYGVMPIHCGVSVEEYITGIKVLINAVTSLNDAAQADFDRALARFETLKKPLQSSQTLSLDPAQVAQFSNG